MDLLQYMPTTLSSFHLFHQQSNLQDYSQGELSKTEIGMSSSCLKFEAISYLRIKCKFFFMIYDFLLFFFMYFLAYNYINAMFQLY